MKSSLCYMVIFFVLYLNCNLAAQNVDTIDVGERDTLVLEVGNIIEHSNGYRFIEVKLYSRSDSLPMAAVSVGFKWMESGFTLDSATVSPEAKTAFDFGTYLYRSQSRDTTNHYQQFLFAGQKLSSRGLAPSESRKLLVTYHFSVSSWTKTSSFTIEQSIFSAGTYMVIRTFEASGKSHRVTPVWGGDIRVLDPNAPCCVNIMGNIDGQDGIDIGDQTLLIDHLFGTGVSLACVDAANVDGSADGSVDMADLIALTEYLFLGGQLAECR